MYLLSFTTRIGSGPMNDENPTGLFLERQKEIEKHLLIFCKGEAHGAKVTVGKENIGSNIGQTNCELLPPPKRFQRKSRDVTEARLDASLQHPLPDCKLKSWPQGTGNHYDNALLKLILS